MTSTNVRVQMQQRRDTAANWTSSNPTLLSGELAYETDTGKFKIGTGSAVWTALGYLPIAGTNGSDYLRLADDDASNYVQLEAPGTVASNVTYVLPGADGSSGQVLSTNGSGVLSWASDTGAVVVDGGNFTTGGSAVSDSSTIDGGSFD